VRSPGQRPSSVSTTKAGPHPEAAAEAGSNGSTLHPKRGTRSAVELPILAQESDIVPHPDPAGENHVPVGELRAAIQRLSLGQREQYGDPLPGNPDHGAGPATLASRPLHDWGCWHTGQ